MNVTSALKPSLVMVTRIPCVTCRMSGISSRKSRMVVFRKFRRAKSYIVEQKIRIEGLDLDKRSEIRFEVRSEFKIEKVLDIWLEAGVGEQAMDK